MVISRTSRRWMPALVASLVLCIVSIGRAQPQQAQGPRIDITPDHEVDGIYKIGETIQWKVKFSGENPPPSLSYTIQKGQIGEFAKGDVALTNGEGVIESKLDEPGTLVVSVNPPPSTQPAANNAGGRQFRRRFLGGAAIAPEQIKPSSERPADFDQFWDDKIKQLNAIPMNAQLTPGESGREGVDYWKITMDNINGSHVNGQLARPTTGEKFPALLVVQWAGVYPLQKPWAVDRARDGWLTLNIIAHDLPIDEPQAFYQQKSREGLGNYGAIGNDDRETSYFLRMYLSCYRGADYLASRPDWDGKTLVVMGTSQGGQQSLLTASIYPKITAALAAVPAGSDMLGPAVGRRGGWPQWYGQTQGKDAAKVYEASKYFDITHFASRIKCPVLVALGLIDETCPPEGIFATLNQITTPKEIVITPRGGHNSADSGDSPYGKRVHQAWLPALKEGKAPPVNQN